MLTIVRRGMFDIIEDVDGHGVTIGNVMALVDAEALGFDYSLPAYHGELSTVLGRLLVTYMDGQSLRQTPPDPLLSEEQIRRELQLLSESSRIGSLAAIETMYRDIYSDGATYTILHMP